MQEVLKSLRIALGSSDTRFSAALGADRKISVTGTVKGAAPYLTRIGTFDVDLSLDGIILLVRFPLPSSEVQFEAGPLFPFPLCTRLPRACTGQVWDAQLPKMEGLIWN